MTYDWDAEQRSFLDAHTWAILATGRRDGSPQLAHLVHAVRATDWGSEMRSRFVFPPGTPDFVAAPMLDHCFTEMTHLAGFLPHLHAAVALTGPPGH